MNLTQTLGTIRKLSWKLSGSIRNFHESFQEVSSKLSCYVGTHFSTRFPPKFLHHGTLLEDKIQKIVKFSSSENQKRNYVITLGNENLLKNFKKRKNQQKSITKIKLNVGDFVLL